MGSSSGTTEKNVFCVHQGIERGPPETLQKMASILKFASIPIKFAPKRKLVNFALPKWRSKMAEIQDVDVEGFINTLYQERTFKTQKEFNEAYDNRLLELLHWGHKPMILTREDVMALETDHRNGAFDTTKPEVLDKLLAKMKAHLDAGERVIFVY